jgi:hypothetical protein
METPLPEIPVGVLLHFTISPDAAVTTLNYTPAWNCCSVGTTPLSIFDCPRSAMPNPHPGVSRNFSALRLHNRSHPFVIYYPGQTHIIFCYLAAVLCHLQQEPFFRVYRFNGA